MSTSYRLTLESAFSERMARNPRYSLRAFARDLGLSASGLSQILSGRQGMTAAKAVEVAGRLGLSVSEVEQFKDQVVAAHGRAPRIRQEAEGRLSRGRAEASQLTIDAFQVVSDWYHFAILELVSLNGFRPSVVAIAKKLGIPRAAVKLAVERLQRLELLEVTEKNRWVAKEDYTFVPGGYPSEVIKKFHRQLLEQALQALVVQPVENRNFASTVMAIRKADLPAARERMKAFRFQMMKEFGGSIDKDAVYCLGTQFFELSV